VFGAQMLDDVVAASLAARRFSMEMVALFGLTALVLAALGIYGVISYMVTARTREIGIRLALGAGRRTIVYAVLRQGLALTCAGAAAGVICAVLVARVMSGALFGVRPTDPPTFAAVALLLVSVALAACYIPARRAIRVDPLVVLKSE
jgi:putative ABC transport system permease protein